MESDNESKSGRGGIRITVRSVWRRFSGLQGNLPMGGMFGIANGLDTLALCRLLGGLPLRDLTLSRDHKIYPFVFTSNHILVR